MNARSAFLLIVLLVSIALIFSPTQVEAVKFSSAFLRLDHTTPTTALSGLICAIPSSPAAGVENAVTITFPSDFTINQTTSIWTTSTTNLPTSATVWPGIGSTAQKVSGSSVTFASADLTSNVQYCFHFTGTSSTTGSIGTDKQAVLTTLTSDGTTIDSTTIGLAITSTDQVSVNAVVPAKPVDFVADLASHNGDLNGQGTVLSYTINYGSNLPYTTSSFTVEASWSLGTIDGSPIPSVDILDYVVGSASLGYANTPPVIDPVNKTITWTITNFPANTHDQQVDFKLRLNDSYTGNKHVTFTVTGRVIGPGGTSSPDSTVTGVYQHDYRPASVGIPQTPVPPTPVPPTPTPPPFAIENISVDSLSSSQAEVTVTTNKDANITLRYGTAPNKLFQTFTALPNVRQQTFTLDDLIPQTSYYFTVTAEDTSGVQRSSGMYVFTTAKISQEPSINPQSVIISSNNTILLANTDYDSTVPLVAILPVSTPYDIRFLLKNADNVTQVQTILRDKYVLGITSLTNDDLSTDKSLLTELEPGTYTGHLLSEQKPGWYTIFAHISDTNGNIVEEKIADLRIVAALTVRSARTKQPLEQARVFLSRYNDRTRVYEDISAQAFSFANPSYTQADGTLALTLPEGDYRAQISTIGYAEQTVEFTIGPGPQEDYPEVFLEPQAFSLVNLFTYYATILTDGFHSAAVTIQSLSVSQRFFDAGAALALTLLVCLSLLSFTLKTHIGIDKLPLFLVLVSKSLFTREHTKYCIRGRVTNEENVPLSGAHVYIIDAKKHKILAHPLSDMLGNFHTPLFPATQYKVTVMKKGFESLPLMNYPKQAFQAPLSFTMIKNEHTPTTLDLVKDALKHLLSTSFELLLVLSFLSELLVGYALGFEKVFLFLLLSLLNLLWWILYHTRTHPAHAHMS